MKSFMVMKFVGKRAELKKFLDSITTEQFEGMKKGAVLNVKLNPDK